MREAQLREGLSRYLSAKRGTSADIDGLVRIPGGASRETWRLDAKMGDRKQGLVVRIDPKTSLIDTERRTEFAAMRAAFVAGLPVPEPLDCEESAEWIGRPFSLSVEMPGNSRLQLPTEQLREKIARQKWTHLGRLARIEISDLDLGGVLLAPRPELCAKEQLDYWERIIDEDELHPNPLSRAAIRWLRRNLPPPPDKLCLVHGDYRTGNFLCTPDGEITAILDWEMAHIGDPLEDLAWSLDPAWSWQDVGLAGRLAPISEAVGYWQEASGMTAAPNALHWWRVFSALKGMGIWTSSSEDFHFGESKSFMLALSGWLMTARHQQVLSDYLSPHSQHRFPGIA